MSGLLNEHVKPSTGRPEPPRNQRGRGGASPQGATPEEIQANHDLYRELMDRFTVLAETCARFSAEVYRRSGTPIESDVEGTVQRNLSIAHTVFSSWSLEILAVIYLNKAIRLHDLRGAIHTISARTLATKLRQLERAGLVQREDSEKEPTETRYYLTHKGLMITRLGEPVFLYLRQADGWRAAMGEDAEARAPHEVPVPSPVSQV